jgi:hypothetical protein
VAFKLHANRLFEKSKNHGIHVIKKDLDMVAGITWPVRTTGMVPNWIVRLAEYVIVESLRAQTDSALYVGATKPAFPE